MGFPPDGAFAGTFARTFAGILGSDGGEGRERFLTTGAGGGGGGEGDGAALALVARTGLDGDLAGVSLTVADFLDREGGALSLALLARSTAGGTASFFGAEAGISLKSPNS